MLAGPSNLAGFVLASRVMLASLMSPLGALLGALGVFTSFYITMWWSAITKATPRESALELGTGFVTNFFDTLGIGSFAPTTAVFKFFKLVPDRLIPGTLNVGHTLPTIAQAFIYTAVDRRRPEDADSHDCRGRRRRLARRGHRRELAEAERPDRHGLGADRRRGPLRVAQSGGGRLPVRLGRDARHGRRRHRHARPRRA